MSADDMLAYDEVPVVELRPKMSREASDILECFGERQLLVKVCKYDFLTQ